MPFRNITSLFKSTVEQIANLLWRFFIHGVITDRVNRIGIVGGMKIALGGEFEGGNGKEEEEEWFGHKGLIGVLM